MTGVASMRVQQIGGEDSDQTRTEPSVLHNVYAVGGWETRR